MAEADPDVVNFADANVNSTHDPTRLYYTYGEYLGSENLHREFKTISMEKFKEMDDSFWEIRRKKRDDRTPEETKMMKNVDHMFKAEVDKLLELYEKYVVAFLNTAGGELLIGVTDEGKVEGNVISHNLEDELKLKLFVKIPSGIKPILVDNDYRCDFIPVHDENGEDNQYRRVIRLSITSPGYNIYRTTKGEVFRRENGNNFKINDHEWPEWCSERCRRRHDKYKKDLDSLRSQLEERNSSKVKEMDLWLKEERQMTSHLREQSRRHEITIYNQEESLYRLTGILSRQEELISDLKEQKIRLKQEISELKVDQIEKEQLREDVARLTDIISVMEMTEDNLKQTISNLELTISELKEDLKQQRQFVSEQNKFLETLKGNIVTIVKSDSSVSPSNVYYDDNGVGVETHGTVDDISDNVVPAEDDASEYVRQGGGESTPATASAQVSFAKLSVSSELTKEEETEYDEFGSEVKE